MNYTGRKRGVDIYHIFILVIVSGNVQVIPTIPYHLRTRRSKVKIRCGLTMIHY